MRTLSKLIALFVLTALPIMGSAQSLSYAKTLIEQERYLEAAKQLRPLADGGNAEAQYLAAMFFFEGKGVTKNVNQGIRYATLSANQGYEYGVILLLYHYNNQPAKQYSTAKTYSTKYPKLLSGELGEILAYCYLAGSGVEKNLKEGIKIIEDNLLYRGENFKKYAKELYYPAKAELAGFDDLEEYDESLFEKNDYSFRFWVADYIMETKYGNRTTAVKAAGELGNSWAKARYAWEEFRAKNYENAIKVGEEAVSEGSYFGKYVVMVSNNNLAKQKPATNSNNTTTNNNSTSYAQTSKPIGKLGTFNNGKYRTNALDVTLTKVEVTRNYTSITLTYRNKTNASQRVSINSNTHIIHRGKTYRMISCNVPSSGTYVSKGDTYYITLDFPHIPSDGTDGFDLIENGLWKFYGIKY